MMSNMMARKIDAVIIDWYWISHEDVFKMDTF